MKVLTTLVIVLTALLAAAPAAARTWSNATGEYTIDADLVTFNERSVVLQRADKELVALPIESLAAADREYLKSKEAEQASQKTTDAPQTWTLRDGTKLIGRIVDYTDHDFVIQQRRRRVYVNDRPLNNFPEFYQQIIPAIVADAMNLPRSDRRGLERWISEQGGAPHTIRVQGVILETENGDEYAVPFKLFTDEDQAVLMPGWDEWQEVFGRKEYEPAEDLGYLLRTLAAARARDQQVQHEIAMLQLKLQAVETRLTSLWEVTLYPARGQRRPPQWVIVPGRDSRQATNTALEMNPDYVAGPVRRVSQR